MTAPVRALRPVTGSAAPQPRFPAPQPRFPAPQPRFPAGAPTADPTQRRLRLVDDARRRAAVRRRRTRAVIVVAAIATAGCLFALAAFNAVLVTGQGRLDDLQRRVTEAQSQYSASRLQVAQLEAPEHIVQVAQQRLGMVPPPGVTYLTPSESMADSVGPAQPAASKTDSGTSWAAVKPYLNGRP